MSDEVKEENSPKRNPTRAGKGKITNYLGSDEENNEQENLSEQQSDFVVSDDDEEKKTKKSKGKAKEKVEFSSRHSIRPW